MKTVKTHSFISIFSCTFQVFLVLYFTTNDQHLIASRDATMIAYHTKVKLEANILITSIEYSIQVNNQAGSKYGQINIPFEAYEKVNVNRTELVDSKGKRIKKFKESDFNLISNVGEIAFFEDSKRMNLDISYNEFPYLIHVAYTLRSEDYLYLANWFPTVSHSLPSQLSTLEIDVAENVHVINYSKGIDDVFEKEESNGRTIYRWKFENYLPYFSQNVKMALPGPSILVLSEKFHYGVDGSFRNWVTYGDWQTRLNVGLDDLTKSEKIKIHAMVDTISDHKAKVDKLYTYLQDNTHYIYISQDIGGMKPLSASFVCEKKYGDCKALTNYMKSMLAEIGIDSYYTIIKAGSNVEPMEELSVYPQFNHVILAVPLGLDTVWLENTNSYLPFGYLGTFTQGRKALLVDGLNSKIINTPILIDSEVKEVIDWDILIQENGKARAIYKALLKGKEYESCRYLVSQFGNEDLNKQIQKTIPCINCEFKNVEFEAYQRQDSFISFVADIELNSFVKQFGNRIIVNPLSILESISQLNIDTIREINYIPFPVNKTLKYTITTEEKSYKPLELEGVEILSEFGSFKSTVSSLNRIVTIEQILIVQKRKLPKLSYDNYLNFLNNINNYLDKNRLQWKN